MKKKNRIIVTAGLLSLVVVLSACGRGDITQSSTGFWDRYIVYYFGGAIKSLSFGNIGIGIILFTLVIRVVLMPLMHYQTKSMRKTQELQPEIKRLQEKYNTKDRHTQELLQAETKKLYAENDVNPYAGCLPMVIQMPILMALWQAISRVPELRQGQFLWLNLSQPDPYFILPVLAAALTFASTYLSSMSQLESNPATKMMNFTMPAMILFMGISLASGLSLYWVISNGFQVLQTMLLNNPFKIRRERAEKAQKIRDREKALEKAKRPKKRKK